jgi:hypothetical protein
MRNDTFFPDQSGDQIDWNTNIITQLAALATELGIDATELASILADCKMDNFLLSDVTEMGNSSYAMLHGFVKRLQRGAMDSPAIELPTLPVWPAAADMPAMVPPGIAARRSAWVAKAKKAPKYNKDTNGRVLRLEPTRTPFDPDSYIAQLKALRLFGPEQVQVTVGKAGGQITMLKLMMRLKGQTDFKQVGMFTARIYLDSTPLAQPGVPETREYQLIAMKNDQPVGQPSPIFTIVVS